MSAHMIFVKLYDMHNFTQQLIVDICLSIRNYLKRLPLLGGRVCYICFLILLMPSNSFACDEDEQCIFHTIESLIKETKSQLSLPNIGILFHHRYHNSSDKIKLVDNYLNYLKNLNNVEFITQEQLYSRYK